MNSTPTPAAPPGASPGLPDTLCHLNGRTLPLSQAQVSVMDRGFIFGDGVYEVIPVYGRRLFRFDAHLARLAHSLQALRIPDPHPRAQWLALVRELVAAQPAEDQLVYIQVTRGVALRDAVPPPGLQPTVFAMSSAHRGLSAEQRHQGVACVSARDFRWERGDLKTVSLLGNVLARQVASDQGAYETILLRDGWLTEASSANVWVVHEGAVLGPPRSPHLLEGVRAGLLAELCEEAGIAFNRRPIAEADLRAADELLLSSAGRELVPVTRLDGETVGHGAGRGRPGPVYARLFEAYQRAKREQSI